MRQTDRAASEPPPAKEFPVTDGALAGLRVIDAATLAAGPLIATWKIGRAHV